MNDQSQNIWEAAIKSFMGPILAFLKDDTVTEILINGPSNIYVERRGKLEKVDASFKLLFIISAKV